MVHSAHSARLDGPQAEEGESSLAREKRRQAAAVQSANGARDTSLGQRPRKSSRKFIRGLKARPIIERAFSP